MKLPRTIVIAALVMVLTAGMSPLIIASALPVAPRTVDGIYLPTPLGSTRLLKFGFAYNSAGEPIQYGAALETYTEPDPELHPSGLASQMLRKGTYNCITRVLVLMDVSIHDKDGNTLAKLAETMPPIGPPAQGSLFDAEFNFMCKGAKLKSCTTKDCT